MSKWKTAAAVAIAPVVLLGLLSIAGVIEIHTPGDLDEAQAEEAETQAEEAVDARDGKRAARRGQRRRKSRHGKKQLERKKQIKSLPYIGEVPITEEDRDKVGVTFGKDRGGDELFVHVPQVYGSLSRKGVDTPWLEAKLIDAAGKELHTWASDEYAAVKRGWRMPRFGDDGDFYVLVDRKAIVRFDWHSTPLWRTHARFHHDFAVEADGGVIALSERHVQADVLGKSVRVIDHGFTFIDAGGNVERTLWFHDAFEEEAEFRRKLEEVVTRRQKRKRARGREDFDVFHANTVEILRGGPNVPWEAGDLMTCFRHQNRVVVLGRDGTIRWTWGLDELDRPHDPSELDSGRVMLFDNGTRRGWSRVVELDPTTNAVTWDWPKRARDDFYSSGRGMAQALGDGRVLIVSSNQGKAFQIDRRGTKLWEFWTPYRVGNVRMPLRMIALEGKALEATRANLAKAPPRKQSAAPLTAEALADESDASDAETDGSAP